MKRTHFLFAGALVVLLALTLVLSPTGALAKKETAKVRGKITALDTTAGTVTVQDKKSGESVTVTVDENTRIHKNEQEGAALTDLAVGDRAGVRYNKETLVAKRIQAKSPKVELSKVHGLVTAIEGQNVTIDPKKGEPVTVVVTDATKITRDDVDAALGDLVVGDHANAKYDPTTMEATKLNAHSASTDGDGE